MKVSKYSARQQRSKSKKKWPQWLRNPCLLKFSIKIGFIVWKLTKWWFGWDDDEDR